LNPKNINHPTSMDELRKKFEAKFVADLKAFLDSCTKDRRDKVTKKIASSLSLVLPPYTNLKSFWATLHPCKRKSFWLEGLVLDAFAPGDALFRAPAGSPFDAQHARRPLR